MLTPLVITLSSFASPLIEGPYANIVVVSCKPKKEERIVPTAESFFSSAWVKKLGKEFGSAEGTEGLLVIARLSAIRSLQDNMLAKFTELGQLDASGTLIAGAKSPELTSMMEQVSPYEDSKQTIAKGNFRLRLIPQVMVVTKDAQNGSITSYMSPKLPKLVSEGLSAITSSDSADRIPPTLISDLDFEEFAQSGLSKSRLADAQKLIDQMKKADHESIMNVLLVRAFQTYGLDYSKIQSLSKDAKEWKDLPNDLKQILGGLNYSSTNRLSAMPSDGTIREVNFGIGIEMGFAGTGGSSAHRQTFIILK